jgi:hypothetical protein
MKQAKEKQQLRKDGQPRQKPGPKPKAKQLEIQRLGPRVRRIHAEAAAAAEPISIVDSQHWPGRDATLTVEEALQQCDKAYGDTAAMMLKSYALAPGQLPSADQAKQMARMCAAAYRCALPTLKAANAQAYIACVAQGVAADVFTGRQGSQLLYAAQVCSGSMRNSNKP